MKTILEYLDRQAEQRPEKAAFCDVQEQLTFSEIKRITDIVGTVLLRHGAFREPVAVLLPRSAKMLAALLGVMRAGCIYVPLDLEMGELRLSSVFHQVEPRFLISDREGIKAANTFGFSGEALEIDLLLSEKPDMAMISAEAKKILDTDAAYIVFTSGSTGAPKGVIGKHSAMLDYAEQLTAVLKVQESDIFGMQAPLYVDACLKELLSVLKCGASLWIVPRQLFSSPVPLVTFLKEHRVTTVCWVVPALMLISALHTFDEIIPDTLKTVAFGSEVFPGKQLKLWMEHVPARYINLYGPTECTGMSCWYEVPKTFSPEDSIPIGRPFDNTEILLIDENGALAEEGEICIRGTAVCHGYWKDPVRTEAAFVQNPLQNAYPERIYRTGDRGRWNSRGELEFLGRIDNQIKHMGHRIELGELEAAAMKIDGVTAACAAFDPQKKRLALAYTGNISKEDLTAGLRMIIPDWMLPSKTIRLEQMPLTANGKTDRRQVFALCFQKTK